MRSIKALIVSASFGFLLSFVFGLFSHAAILIILLRALITAAVFAGLGFGISFVSDKFLFEDSDSSDISVESVPENQGGLLQAKMISAVQLSFRERKTRA